MKNLVILLIAVVICATFTSVRAVEFEEEFKKGSARTSDEEKDEGRGLSGGLGWQSGLFNFDEEFFWPRTRSRPGQSGDKEIAEGSREPLDVDFVSGTIGGGSDDDGFRPAAGESPVSSPFFPFGNNFGFGGLFPFHFGGGASDDYKPWWKGDNVCVEREEDIEDWEQSPGGSSFSGAFNVNFEACEDKPNKHVCTTVTNFQGKKRTVTESRMCCYGYAQSRAKKGHCEKIDLKSVVATAEQLGANEFLRSAKNNGLKDKLSENVTLFVPLDGAFTDFSEQMFETNLVVLPLARSRRAAPKDVSGITTKDLALGHMVAGFNLISEMENEQVLSSEFNTTIRINIFPTPSGGYSPGVKYTANCVPLTAYDKLATNGIVHTVQSVLVPVTQTLLELVQERSDLVVFRTILEKTDLAEQLSNQDKTFTVFAPNDNAFTKLEPSIRRIVKEGNACALNILKNHILDLTFCGAAVVEKAKTNTYNLLGEKLQFERKAEMAEESNNTESQDLAGKADILINKSAKVVESDLMATNGVLHVIDTVLQTASATPISVALESQNLTIFKRLIEAAGLEDTFNGLSNVSFFVPSDKAFEQSEWKSIIEDNPESLKDNADLRSFLEYHVGTYVKTCNLTEDMIATKADGKLRVNLYSTHPIFSNVMNRATVNCARLTQFDVDSCGAVLHQVDKVLEPPTKSLLELLETPKYSKFLSLIREANLTDLIADTDKEYTLLVPSDEVFAEQEEWYERLLKDKDELERVIKSHIVPDVLCCTAFVPSDWPFIRTIQTINQKSLRIDRNRRPLIANAGITKCDVMATNGIVHEINDVIVIKENRRTPLFF